MIILRFVFSYKLYRAAKKWSLMSFEHSLFGIIGVI